MTCRAFPPIAPGQGRLVSRFGVRAGMTSGAPTFHAGIDIGAAPIGAPIMAAQDGTVALVSYEREMVPGMRGYGNCVALLHGSGLYSFYAHMNVAYVRIGATVEAGAAIGEVGRTTNGKFPGMGPHLHFEVRRPREDGSSPVPGPYRRYNLDPIPWLAEMGITFGERGVIIVDWARACSGYGS